MVKHFSVLKRVGYNYGTTRGVRIGVSGVNNSLGQTLSLLLRTNPLVNHLRIHDFESNTKIGDDLCLISSPNTVESFVGPFHVGQAFRSCDIVIICGGSSFSATNDEKNRPNQLQHPFNC
jgi:malate/lactate dehydrogenase